MITREEALRYRAKIETAVQSLDDKDSSETPTLFPSIKYDGSLIKAGTKINWNGTLKRAASDLWDTEENDPEKAPDLWENIAYRDGIRIIPETITAGLVFGMDELGWWRDELYKSKLQTNTYTPEQYPDGWEKIEENGEGNADS